MTGSGGLRAHSPRGLRQVIVTLGMCIGLLLAIVPGATANTPGSAPDDAQVGAGGAATDTDGDGLTDAFEIRYGLDPNNDDSNGDGLLDPAEDLDRDGLSNLGEQTFGTNPNVRDTDGDGIDDGNDDANGDGVMDWHEQDRRPLPYPLHPKLDQAPNDWLCYRPGQGSTGACIGDPNGTATVAIYGDSHAGQWIATLNIVAKGHHWHLVAYAKSGCPSVHVDPTNDPKFNSQCRAWRARSEQEIRQDPPGLVIISNYSHYGPHGEKWSHGLKLAIDAMPKTTEVMVLADTPEFPQDVPTCLRRHRDNIGVCEVPRSIGISAAHDKLERSTAEAAGATFATMNPYVCPYRLCPVVVGHLLMWRDVHHLTVTYARHLYRAFDLIVPAALPQ